jgi:hypothetical protein
MQQQTNGTGGLATLEATQPLGWQVEAVGEYERSWPIRQADLRTELAARILALTGRQVSPQEIYAAGRLAVAGVDGVTFRLDHHDLAVARTCAYCGTGSFESPKISSVSDLGYALSVWTPLHEDCEYFSPEEFPDF